MEIKIQKLSADELKRIGVFNWPKAIITLFFLFLFLSTAFAEISLKAEVDKTSLTIEVTPGKARPKTPPEQRPSLAPKIQPESEEPQITL